jgi:hypothetical protein
VSPGPGGGSYRYAGAEPRRAGESTQWLRLAPVIAALAAFGGLGCSVGEGDGSVTSADLFVDGCWDGEFNLRPTFFGANPFEDTLTIRVQRGERNLQVSDGISLLVYDVPAIREFGLNQMLPLGLPVGVSPLGFPLPPVPNPPAATLTLYLNNSCAGHNAVLLSVSGYVMFTKLFSGDLNEESSEARITEGVFHATVTDPRVAVPSTAPDGTPTYTYPEGFTSDIDGDFNFVFHRGTPAQPFP